MPRTNASIFVIKYTVFYEIRGKKKFKTSYNARVLGHWMTEQHQRDRSFFINRIEAVVQRKEALSKVRNTS